MPRHIVCTVGTSLLTNRDGRLWGGWSPQSKAPLPAAHEVDAWLRSADKTSARAEINTLERLDLDQEDLLVLLHSDTPEGRFCAERIRTFYAGGKRSFVPPGGLRRKSPF